MLSSQAIPKCLSNDRHPLYLRAVQREIDAWSVVSPAQVLSNSENHPVVLAYQTEILTGSTTAKYGEWMNAFVLNYSPRANALSLGNGTGLPEQELFDRQFVERLDAIDLVNLKSQDHNTRVRLLHADLNFIELQPNRYDLVFCHGVLHHIINLEWLAYQICQTLTDDGIVIVYEYIGEDRWQWTEERQTYLNRRLRSAFGNRYSDFAVTRPAQSAMSSFESIRSSEVWPVLIHQFGQSIERQAVFGGALYPILNSLARMRHYTSDDVTHILKFAVELDREVTGKGNLGPCLLFGIYRKGHYADAGVRAAWDENEIRQRLDERLWLPPMLRVAEAVKRIPYAQPGYRRVKAFLRK